MTTFDKIIGDRINEAKELIDSLPLDDFKKKQIKTNWLDSIFLMETLTKKHYKYYNYLNITTIVGGVLIPVVINLPFDLSKLTATFLGIIVSISAGVNQSYRFNDRWRHFRLISEELKIEGERFFALGEKYIDFNTHDNDAFKLFVTNIELIKENQIDTYLKKIAKSDDKQTDKKTT